VERVYQDWLRDEQMGWKQRMEWLDAELNNLDFIL
jgi:hypothetical protein